MRHLTAWLEDGYCSINVANHQLITVIRFVSKSYTHPWKGFTNRLHLVLYADIRFFVKLWCDLYQAWPHSRSHEYEIWLAWSPPRSFQSSPDFPGEYVEMRVDLFGGRLVKHAHQVNSRRVDPRSACFARVNHAAPPSLGRDTQSG